MKLIHIILTAVIVVCSTGLCSAQLPTVYQADDIIILDTKINSKRPYTPADIQYKRGWRPVEKLQVTGDLYIENSRLILILRKYSTGPEAYYKIGPQSAPAFNLRPVPVDDDTLNNSQSYQILSFDPIQLHLETTIETESEKSITLEYSIRPFRADVEIRPDKDVHQLVLQSVSRYIIIPDLFADDLLIDPLNAPSKQIYLPEDNHMLVQLIDDGQAVIVCNWLSDDDNNEIELNLSKNVRQRLNCQTIINLDNKDKLWVSVLARPGIWYHLHSSQLNIYEQVPLGWIVPFQASWRADYQRADRRARGLTDSFWNVIMLGDGTFMSAPGLMEMQIIDGQYVIQGPQEIKRLVRRSVVNEFVGNGWWPFLGWFNQPFYMDGNRAFMKLPKYDQLTTARYVGPIVIYPLMNEIIDDPTSQTVEDVLRDTLGVNYLNILDLAELNRRPDQDYYPPTCFTTEYCERIFNAYQEIARRNHIVSMLEQMKIFVANTRDRLDTYVEWEKDMQLLYQQYRDTDPNIVPVIHTLDDITSRLSKRFDRELPKMKTPQRAADLADHVIDLINDRTMAKIARCHQTCEGIRDIGDTQDELLGELRDIVKIARQRAGVLHTQQKNPRTREFLRLVRARTQEILRISYDMEGKQ